MRHAITKGTLLFLCVLGAISGYLISDGTISIEPESLSAAAGYGIIGASAFLFVFVLRLPPAK